MPDVAEEVDLPISWSTAANVARQALRLSPPLLDTATAERLVVDFETATRRADELVAEFTGLHAEGSTKAVVTDRVGWVDTNLASFGRLVRPFAARLAANGASTSGPLAALRAHAAGAEVGLLLAWMSSKVLGQYDLAPADGAGDSVYYVGHNIVAVERRYGFPPSEFRLWIALHEVAHRLQFSGIAWMRPYFGGLLERGAALAMPDAGALTEAVSRTVAELRAGRNPLAAAGLVGLLASEEQRATLGEAQALMSVLEGHGDIVMSRAGRELIPGAQRFSRMLSERRSRARGLQKLAQQALGFDAKLRQYAAGERFLERLIEEEGEGALARLWEGPEMLPNLEELRSPARWLARVGTTRAVS